MSALPRSSSTLPGIVALAGAVKLQKVMLIKPHTLSRLAIVSVLCTYSVVPARASNQSAVVRASEAVGFQLSGNPEAAATEYRRALEGQPNSAALHLQLGQILLDQLGDMDGAISEFMTAASIDPSCAICKVRLDEALRLRNSNVYDLIALGNELYSARQYKRAEAMYRLAAQSDPRNADAHNSLAWVLYKEGNLNDGLQEIDEALSLKPDDPELVNTLACLLYDNGDVSGAVRNWQKAISLSKSPGAADLYGLAVASLTGGNTAKAAMYFEEALKVDPNYRNIAYIRDKVGMSARSLAFHEKLTCLAKKN